MNNVNIVIMNNGFIVIHNAISDGIHFQITGQKVIVSLNQTRNAVDVT
jgi:hypothetical protein